MSGGAQLDWMAADQDRRLSEVVEREAARLRGFIRRRVGDAADAEDVLQDVFSELLLAYRLMQPIERVATGALLALAVRIGKARLIDNRVLGST